jgi:thiol-disulfide isomerase/thioredoxin
MTPSLEATRSHAKRRLAVIVAGGIAGVVAGFAGIYGIGLLLGNRAVEAACRPTIETAQRVAPFARGEVAAVNAAKHPVLVPDLAFRSAEGTERRLSDWRGRTVLFNLWATWCVPCRKEMPALDELQARLGGSEFEVVAVNIDTRDPDKPKAWLDEVGIRRLGYYADPTAKVFQELKQAGKAWGMPTTLLIDGAGCEIATLAGPAEWASDDAIRLVNAALGRAAN